MLMGSQCIATMLTCGAGSHDDSGSCVPDAPPRFRILAAPTFGADSQRPIEVRVLGTNADGTLPHDPIVLNTDRPGAGQFDEPSLTLDDSGRGAMFTPCDAATPGCLGPVTLTVALASAPTVPVAHVDVELIEPPTVGSAVACPSGSNILVLRSTSFEYVGTLTITDATWSINGSPVRATISVRPTNPLQSTLWTIDFDTIQLGTPMTPGTYLLANSYQLAGKPGMTVRGVTAISDCGSGALATMGEFQVHEYTLVADKLKSFTTSFRAHCQNDPSLVVDGCIHVER